MIKLIAIDIDGTITFFDRKLDTLAVDALRKAEAAGVKVSLATGNILLFAEAAAVLVGASGPIIAEDGGIVFDQVSKKEKLLGDRKEVDKGLAILRKRFWPLKETRNSPQRLTGLTFEKTVSVADVQKVLSGEGLNLIAVDSGFAIHIREPQLNKGSALKEVSAMTGIPLKDIAAIGDGPNDVEMLRAAGVSFAVANAPNVVKEASTSATKSAHGKGVAEAVDSILNSRVFP